MRVDPMAVTAGRTARLNVLLDNTGNTAIHRRLHGQDPESRVALPVRAGRGPHRARRARPGRRPRERPPAVPRQPGRPAARAPPRRARLRPDSAPPPEPGEGRGRGRQAQSRGPVAGPEEEGPAAPHRRRGDPGAGERDVRAAADGLARGRSRCSACWWPSRVFAVVITLALSRIVGQSAADRNLALEIAAAREGGSSSGTSGMGGTVTLLTSKAGRGGRGQRLRRERHRGADRERRHGRQRQVERSASSRRATTRSPSGGGLRPALVPPGRRPRGWRDDHARGRQPARRARRRPRRRPGVGRRHRLRPRRPPPPR